MFQKRNGEVARRFHVKMTAPGMADTGVLDEHLPIADAPVLGAPRVDPVKSPTAAAGYRRMTSEKAKASRSGLATPSLENTPATESG